MKRKLSLLMALILVLSSSTVVFGQSSDYASNWAKDEISYMVGKGIINGYPDGTFKPTNNMSKAEFYTVINGLVGYSEKAEVEYEDVNPGSWYYGEVQKASKANYLPTGKILNPEDKITRGEVARIIGNVFGIEEDVVSANKFVDGGKLPKEIKGIVGGLRKGGYIAGYPDGTFRHESEISRAEVVKMLHTVSGEIVNEASTINKDAKTNLVVSTKDVVLKDMVIEGNLYLTEGIGEGDVTLDNVEVKGELSIKGGGENSIIIKNSKINKVSIGKQQGRVRVVFENTTVNQVTTLREVKIELTNETKIETVELDGKVELAVGEGTAIDTLSSVSKEVNIESKGTIESIKTKEDVKVNGKVVKSGTEVKVDAGKTKEVKPKETPKQETTRPSSSGGWGGSSGQTPRPTPTVVSAISVDKTELVLAVMEPGVTTGIIVATVSPNNAADKTVTWISSDETVATVDENGKVTAIAAGEATITAKAGNKTATTEVSVKEPQAIKVEGNGFVNSSTYKGVFVEILLPGKDNAQIQSLKVELFNDANELIGTNKLIDSTKAHGVGITSPFVVIPGGYTSGSWTTEWVAGEPSFVNTPKYAVLTAVDENGVSYTAQQAYSGDWRSVWAKDITVASANDFGVISEAYKGVSAIFALGGIDVEKIGSIKVEIFGADDVLLATNTLKAEKLPVSEGNLTAPFVAIEEVDGYKTSSWVTEWTSGNPDPLTPPSYVKMTLTDENGLTYSAEESNLHTLYSGGKTWSQLWAKDITVASANDSGINDSAAYKGVVATFKLGGTDLEGVESIKVEVFDAEDTLLATNILKSDKLPKNAGNLTSPIVAIEGTYEYGAWYKTEWAEGYPNPLTPPSYVKMTLTDENGLTYSAKESNLHTLYSGGGDWASLWGIDHIVTDQTELDAAIVDRINH